jgi:hypothetical protein
MLHFVLIENYRLPTDQMGHVRSFERDRLNERLPARVGRSGFAPAEGYFDLERCDLDP